MNFDLIDKEIEACEQRMKKLLLNAEAIQKRAIQIDSYRLRTYKAEHLLIQKLYLGLIEPTQEILDSIGYSPKMITSRLSNLVLYMNVLSQRLEHPRYVSLKYSKLDSRIQFLEAYKDPKRVVSVDTYL